MLPGLLIKLRPSTPWRIAPDSGARDQVDSIYHSDSLYSAVTHALGRLGHLDSWLAATAFDPAGPAVRFSSCYPFLDGTLLIPGPRNLWPPPPSSRVRWKGARFIPVPVAESLIADPEARLREDDGWIVDAESSCLLPAGKGNRALAPFRVGRRRTAAIDRFTGASAGPVTTACLEFAPGAGLWFVAAFREDESIERWRRPLEAALRLLADSGFGGGRSRGWGRADAPEIHHGRFPGLVMSPPALPAAPEGAERSAEAPPAETAYWLLSLFSPGPEDKIDWSRGSYTLLERAGRVESYPRSGDLKRRLRMVGEGSVLISATPPRGAAPDVAPIGFPHPVYRAGFALAIPIVWRVSL
ncbi:MAG: hypothetical protein HY235_18570 [Acidobacteria bacterium]|nr:hypothetical protein [Acidobacteriota bacterium]